MEAQEDAQHELNLDSTETSALTNLAPDVKAGDLGERAVEAQEDAQRELAVAGGTEALVRYRPPDGQQAFEFVASAYVSIRQHTSAYVSIARTRGRRWHRGPGPVSPPRWAPSLSMRTHI